MELCPPFLALQLEAVMVMVPSNDDLPRNPRKLFQPDHLGKWSTFGPRSSRSA